MPDPHVTAPVTLAVTSITAPITQARDAYQLAVAEGFVGTREEWLASLTNGVVVSATEPVNLFDGLQWLNTVTGILATYYADQGIWVTNTPGLGGGVAPPVVYIITLDGQVITLDGNVITL